MSTPLRATVLVCFSAASQRLFSTTGRAQPESSFNTNGSAPPYNLMKRFGGLTEDDAWLAPNPGGAASWGLGYYPAGVKGVGGSGSAAMYVLSTEEWFGATW